MTTIDLYPNRDPTISTILFILVHDVGGMQYLAHIEPGKRTMRNFGTGQLLKYQGDQFVQVYANLGFGMSHSNFLEYATDDFLKYLRENWCYLDTSFNIWVEDVIERYGDTMKPSESVRLRSLKTPHR